MLLNIQRFAAAWFFAATLTFVALSPVLPTGQISITRPVRNPIQIMCDGDPGSCHCPNC